MPFVTAFRQACWYLLRIIFCVIRILVLDFSLIDARPVTNDESHSAGIISGVTTRQSRHNNNNNSNDNKSNNSHNVNHVSHKTCDTNKDNQVLAGHPTRQAQAVSVPMPEPAEKKHTEPLNFVHCPKPEPRTPWTVDGHKQLREKMSMCQKFGFSDGFTARTSLPFTYPDASDTTKYVIYIKRTGQLSSSDIESLLQEKGVIFARNISLRDDVQVSVGGHLAAKPGWYEIHSSTGQADVCICRFQSEHVGHRGCFAAGYSYFLCGMSHDRPAYRVVAIGRYDFSYGFVLSRSYAGDCEAIRHKLHRTRPNCREGLSSDFRTSIMTTTRTTTTPRTAKSTMTSTMCVEKGNPYGYRTSPLTNGAASGNGVHSSDPVSQKCRNAAANQSPLDECLHHLKSRKSDEEILRNMAVLLHKKCGTVEFHRRVCGTCPASNQLFDETRRLYRPMPIGAQHEINNKMMTARGSDSGATKNTEGKASKKAQHVADGDVQKYIYQKYRLISRFDADQNHSLKLNETAWFSICPEEIAKHIGRRIADLSRKRNGRKLRVADPCCGAGGNAVQCAIMAEVEHVYAFDIDSDQVESAKRLASLYDVDTKMTIEQRNLFDLSASDVSKVDALVFSPPWGGPGYLNEQYDLSQMRPLYRDILLHCHQLSPNMAVVLPRNACFDQIVDSLDTVADSMPPSASNNSAVELELNFIAGKCKTATVYYGELVNEAALTGSGNGLRAH